MHYWLFTTWPEEAACVLSGTLDNSLAFHQLNLPQKLPCEEATELFEGAKHGSGIISILHEATAWIRLVVSIDLNVTVNCILGNGFVVRCELLLVIACFCSTPAEEASTTVLFGRLSKVKGE